MSGLRRRKAGAPASLLAAVAATSGADSKDAGGKDAAVGFVPQKPGATWLETHQWGLVPLLITLGARECLCWAAGRGCARFGSRQRVARDDSAGRRGVLGPGSCLPYTFQTVAAAVACLRALRWRLSTLL